MDKVLDTFDSRLDENVLEFLAELIEIDQELKQTKKGKNNKNEEFI